MCRIVLRCFVLLCLNISIIVCRLLLNIIRLRHVNFVYASYHYVMLRRLHLIRRIMIHVIVCRIRLVCVVLCSCVCFDLLLYVSCSCCYHDLCMCRLLFVFLVVLFLRCVFSFVISFVIRMCVCLCCCYSSYDAYSSYY